MMYLDHFGLREAPFRITPHTEFFFSGANRGATLEALVYAITHDEGIVKVSGEVGSGKTMLCRMLLERLPDTVTTVYLANPSLSRDEILYAIADELASPLPESRRHQLLGALQETLIERYASGGQVVVMIDEAHAMPAETLEEIRLLSNLETNRHKLLHIVLFGQPELDARLADSGMRQLKERITHNFALEPLRRDDIGTYLMFRLRAAGYKGPDLFTANAVQLISKASEGLTRRINILADKALLSAFAEGTHQIDQKQVKAAIRDAQFNPMRDSHTPTPKWIAAAAIAIALAGGAYFTGKLAGNSAATNTNAALPAPVAPSPPATTTQAPEQTPPSTRAARVLPGEPRQSEQAGPETTRTDLPPKAQPLLSERLAATDEWLKKTPNSRFFIQLLSTDASNQRDVDLFLATCCRPLDPAQLRVYRSTLSGRDRLGVIYGDYPSPEAAATDLRQLAQLNPNSKPYLRSVSKLR